MGKLFHHYRIGIMDFPLSIITVSATRESWPSNFCFPSPFLRLIKFPIPVWGTRVWDPVHTNILLWSS